ncbi:uncharacterized protein BP5553_00235 [Venustampulla echinocandica]|uniref:Uncharacterized protein n=1 Tax=Venustampulla echinocandica TaxID=2656787 RepID=A0A370TXJ2_9HELO|nr:uncharacterized protein BP5553_00235 [Venustampulla echinocandica]RDL40256.1 hypothetical protein BP5553_00235 [Venustampulla echinocandica]
MSASAGPQGIPGYKPASLRALKPYYGGHRPGVKPGPTPLPPRSRAEGLTYISRLAVPEDLANLIRATEFYSKICTRECIATTSVTTFSSHPGQRGALLELQLPLGIHGALFEPNS